MAASVLGKRSRRVIEAEGIASALPTQKRARRSIPQIFEDDNQSQARAAELQSPASSRIISRAQRPKKPAVQQRQSKSRIAQDVDIQDAPAATIEQDENNPSIDVLMSTPSTTRFKNVIETVASTPKHRVRVLGGLLTPTTPRSVDLLKERTQNVYASARKLFTTSANPTKLIGRDVERQQLRDFITQATSSNCGGCQYVSGPPGTGKSALVQEVLQEFEGHQDVQISVVNCVTMRTSTQIYGKLLEDLTDEITNTKVPAETRLRRLFTSKSRAVTHVVMLDEIDSLVDAECEILYTIFEWAMLPSSSLTLIGIANALDLTDRFLPRLKSRGLKPTLLPFLPYTAQQISTIISDKLRSLLPKDSTVPEDFVPCLHPAAVQLCGKKIASQSGDLRKAFSLIRRAIDQVEKDTITKQLPQPLGEVTNSSQLASPQRTSRLSSFTAENAPRATVAHMAKLAASIFNNSASSRLSGLNLQQKAVLCSVVRKENKQERNLFATPTKTANKAPTVGELFSRYTSLCKRNDTLLQPLKDTEFRDVVASLETLGLIFESKGRSSSLLTPTSSSRTNRNINDRPIASTVSEKEVRDSLDGPGADLLRRLLDENCVQ